MRQQTALVTGASSGIGYEVARRLARRGHRVVMTSRDSERLEGAAQALRDETGATFHIVSQDIAAPDAALQLRAWCEAQNLMPDILINNAGIGYFGAVGNSEWDNQRDMVEINVRALTHLTHTFLPHLLEAQHGYVLHVGSLAGFCPGPLMAVYYASKAYVLSFSLAVRNEVVGQGIRVSCLCPGPVRTRFQERAGLSTSKLAQASFLEPDVVAREALRGLARNQAIIIPGRRGQAFALMARYLPPTWTAAFIRRVQDSK